MLPNNAGDIDIDDAAMRTRWPNEANSAQILPHWWACRLAQLFSIHVLTTRQKQSKASRQTKKKKKKKKPGRKANNSTQKPARLLIHLCAARIRDGTAALCSLFAIDESVARGRGQHDRNCLNSKTQAATEGNQRRALRWHNGRPKTGIQTHCCVV